MYCVYLTVYFGNKMPMFYLGSSIVEKVKKGYRGSVKSKKYAKIFSNELKNNPHLFKTIIISEYSSRSQAFDREYQLQKSLKVSTSPMYINEALASPFFCQRNIGKNNGMFGKKHSEHSKEKMRKPKSSEARQKMSKPKTEEHKKKFLNNKNWQYRDYSKKEQCKYCGKFAMKTNITRWHNENCKHKN